MQTINLFENIAKNTHYNLANKELFIKQAEEIKKSFFENDQKSLKNFLAPTDLTLKDFRGNYCFADGVAVIRHC